MYSSLYYKEIFYLILICFISMGKGHMAGLMQATGEMVCGLVYNNLKHYNQRCGALLWSLHVPVVISKMLVLHRYMHITKEQKNLFFIKEN